MENAPLSGRLGICGKLVDPSIVEYEVIIINKKHLRIEGPIHPNYTSLSKFGVT